MAAPTRQLEQGRQQLRVVAIQYLGEGGKGEGGGRGREGRGGEEGAFRWCWVHYTQEWRSCLMGVFSY